MDSRLLDEIEEIALALKGDKRLKELKDAEDRMLSDSEVIELIKRKNAMEDEYSLVLSYSSRDSEQAKKAQHELYLAKKALDEHPLVKEYNDAYLKARDLYLSLDEIIFGPYRGKSLTSEAK